VVDRLLNKGEALSSKLQYSKKRSTLADEQAWDHGEGGSSGAQVSGWVLW
jgi:hypothetical protein